MPSVVQPAGPPWVLMTTETTPLGGARMLVRLAGGRYVRVAVDVWNNTEAGRSEAVSVALANVPPVPPAGV
jgi:hypothetical protein